MSNLARWMTPGECAIEAGCSIKTIYRAIKAGTLFCHRVNTRVLRIPHRDFIRWMSATGTTQPWKSSSTEKNRAKMSARSFFHWHHTLGLDVASTARILGLDLRMAYEVEAGKLPLPDDAARVAFGLTGVSPSSLTRPDREVSLAWDGSVYTAGHLQVWIRGKPLALLRQCFGDLPPDQLGDLFHSFFDAATSAMVGDEFQTSVAEFISSLAEDTDRGILVEARHRFVEKHPHLGRVFDSLLFVTGHGPRPLAADTAVTEPASMETVPHD